MTVVLCALVALSALAVGCLFIWLVRPLDGTGVSWLTRLVMLNVLLVLPVSGLVHIADIDGVSRGFYDLMTDPEGDALWSASLMSLVCVLGFILGCSWNDARQRGRVERRSVPRPGARLTAVLLGAAVLLSPLCLTANRAMVAYASQSQQARIISVESGQAISYYLATWLPWVITFAAVALLGGVVGRTPVFAAAVTAAAIVAMATGLLWTGGRTLVLVMALPLVVVALPRLRGLRPLFVIAGVSGTAAFVWTITQARVGARSGASSGWSWVDWQWGRFSMVGFSHDYVSTHGLLWGETLINAVLTPVQAVASLMGSSILAGSDYRSAVELTAYQLTNEVGATYVVPGMAAEFYLNFGWVGVIAGSILLGYWTRACDRKILRSRDDVEKLWWGYVGGLLLLRTFASDSGAFVGYLTFTGAPLIAVYLVTRSWPTRRQSIGRRATQGMTATPRAGSRSARATRHARS